MTIHHRTCPLCEAMCGLTIETEGTRITSIRGDRDDPLSRGFLCPKGPALKALQEDPDRLTKPVKRVDGRFVEIGWEEALDLAAEGLHRVREAHGRNAVAVYVGNPTVHNLGASVFAPTLIKALRTKNRFSATSVDQLPHHLAAYLMFGHQFLIPVPDVDHTTHMLILGANPLASNGSLMSAPNMRGRLKAIQSRGGKVVVVDPRRTETAKLADAHHFIRPGTDAWLLAAIAKHALSHGRGLGPLAAHTAGLGRLAPALAPFGFEEAAKHTGIAAEAIEAMARALCEAPRAICYGRMGTSTQAFGGIATWLVSVINLLTGNFDRVGGMLFTTPAVDAINLPMGLGIGRGSFGRWRSRVRELPEVGGELPVATLADEILTPGDGQIRALVTSAGNPVLSTPNGARLGQAIGQLEHVVCIDFFINETTRHAHVILPPPSPLERPHYDIAFQHLAVHHTAKLSLPLFEPQDDQRHDHEIMLDLVERLARLSGRWDLKTRARIAAMRRLGPVGVVDLSLRLGPHGPRPFPPRRGLSAKALLETPSGVDLGPLTPSMPERMRPWKDALDIAPAPYVEDLARLEESAMDDALVLIGRRHLRSNNSWMHNVPKLMAGKPICTLMMHPEDADERGVSDGEPVRVTSRVGEVTVPVEVTEDVMRGVVSLPHGFGHDRPGVRLEVARRHAGVSVNDLTDELAIDALTGNAALNGVPVAVAPT
ncbi:MAG: molybdopterin oxidoreductase family protein [Sandaracinaceae bacterium]